MTTKNIDWLDLFEQLKTRISELQAEVSQSTLRLQSSSSQQTQLVDDLTLRLRESEEQVGKLQSQEAELKTVVSKLMLAVQQAEMKAEQRVQSEKQQLLSEFDKIMTEKITQQKQETDVAARRHANA